jgi:hypothetical protein
MQSVQLTSIKTEIEVSLISHFIATKYHPVSFIGAFGTLHSAY